MMSITSSTLFINGSLLIVNEKMKDVECGYILDF
jgi:hypothetical protein